MKNKYLILQLILVIYLFFTADLLAQNPGDAIRYKKIDNSTGNLGTLLPNFSYFGTDVCNIGDINNDGVTDIAVGAPYYGSYGAVFILLMDTNGTVQSKKILTQNTNGITGLSSGDAFGYAIGSLGDINNDGVNDIVVSAIGCSDGGSVNTGAVFIIKLNSSGAAISQSKISKTSGNGTGGIPISNGTFFGLDVDSIGDLNNDGIIDLVVGNYADSTAGDAQGAAWVLLLDTNYTVLSYLKIYDGIPNFNASMNNNDRFGMSVVGIGDYDLDGVLDIAVSAHWDDDGIAQSGAFYIIHLDTNASIKSFKKISNNSFPNSNPFYGNFATGLGMVGDIDGNGVRDFIGGMPRIDSDRGGFYVLLMDTNENPISVNKTDHSDISLNYSGRFGRSFCYLGDYNSDGYPEIAVGAAYDNSKKGAIYIVSLKSNLSVNISHSIISCHGDSTGTAIAVGIGGSPPYTYLWSNGSTNDTITNLAAGTYTVTITNSLNATATSSVVIAEPTAIAISTSPDTSFCLGMSTTISANASGGSGSKILYWDNNLSNASSHFVMPTQTTNYSVYATDANNCISDTSSILVSVSPIPNVSFTGLALMNCLNDSLIGLTGSPTGGSFAGLGIIGNNFDPSIAGVGIHPIIYNYTNSGGCSGADTNYTLINDIPTVYAGSDTLLPCGSQGVLIGEPSEAGHTYVWSPYAGLNNPFISTPTANPWMNSTFVLTKKSLSTQCSNTDTVIINLPSGLPLINIVGDTNLCDGDSLHLVAMTNANDITWDYGITGTKFDYLPTNSEFIAVTVKDNNLCVSKDSVFVTVNPLPQPFLGNDTSIFLNDTLILDAGNYSSYLWSTGANTQTISIIGGLLSVGNHSFAVSVIDQNQCAGNDDITLSIVNAIEEKESDLPMKVYPNPTSGIITFKWESDLNISSVEIYDTYGKRILQQSINPSDITIQLDLSTYATGIYFAKIKSQDSERMIKIVLE